MRRFLNFLVVYLFNFKKISIGQLKGLHQVKSYLLNLLKLVFLKFFYIKSLFECLSFLEFAKKSYKKYIQITKIVMSN